MYCPNCGKQNSADQKFCRSCGLGLQKVAQTLSEQLPTKLDLSLQQKKERFEKLGVAALSVFGAGVAIPILYGIFYKMMYTQGKVTAGLGLLALIIVLGCGLLSVILFAKANEVKELPANRPTPEPIDLKSADTRELPEYTAQQTPAFSVTDRTTELLAEETKAQAKGNG
ncbi:MAG: zinc-ribbon domain-containing protein [Pyrinomonadaceae bacterium]